MAAEALMGGDGPGGPGGSGRRTPGVTQGRGGRGTRPRIPGTGPTVTQGRGGQGTRPRIPGTGPRITGGGSRVGIIYFQKIIWSYWWKIIRTSIFCFRFLFKKKCRVKLMYNRVLVLQVGLGFSAGLLLQQKF